MNKEKKTVISPPARFAFPNLAEVYNYRQLIYSLAWRDIKVKYAQTYVGVLWVLLQPVIAILLLSFVFQKVATIGTEGVPPLLYIMCGYWSWSFFASAVALGGSSIVSAQEMVKKIYFPKLTLPLSVMVTVAVDSIIVFIFLLALLVYYQQPITYNLLAFPIVIIATIMCSLTLAIWVSAASIRYRDFRFVVPFLLQIGLFVTPIAYSINQVPSLYQKIYQLNPMVGIVEASRWSLLSIGDFPSSFIYSIVIVFVFGFLGLFYFGKVEQTIADLI